ncbi:MAG: sulfatase-like hydrolase/transferase [Bacteroidetes bacterium]|nr:sulfatase-like hydrolase/transferase [Bacteroidota bacterium]
MRIIESVKAVIFRYPILSSLLFTAFFVVAGFHEMQDYLNPGSLIGPLAGMLIFVSAFFFVCKKITGNSIKPALITTAILMPVLFFGFASDLFPGAAVCQSVLRYRYILILFPTLIIFFVVKIIKSRRTFVRFNQFLFSFAFFLLFTELIKIAYYPFGNKAWNDYTYADEQVDLPVTLPAGLPNVYYLLFDMHTGSESLKKYWDYADTSFVKQLESRNFYVVKNARSNYNFTLYSLASAFSMQHLNKLPEYKQGIGARINSLGKVIRENKAAGLFHTLGYDIINLSPFDLCAQPRLYTRYYTFSLSRYLWRKTFPGKVLTDLSLGFGKVIDNFFQEEDNVAGNKRVLTKLNEFIEGSKENKKATFVYAHFLLPHYPYHYNRKGELRAIESDSIGDKEKYLDQLIYTDDLIMKITDSILANSAVPPVIIIQGDHGFNMLGGSDKINEANSILNAIHLPREFNNKVPATITPVNTFRFVFNSVFGFHFKQEEDRLYYVNENTFDCTEIK